MKRMFERLLGGGKAEPAQLPAGGTDPAGNAGSTEELGWLRDHIRRDVAGGFNDEDAILIDAIAAFEGSIPQPALRVEAQRLLREAMADHAAAERDWPERTDCDRLDEAFSALEARGVISRQNFSCCGTCGASEIWGEMEAVDRAGGPVRGYAFYNMQDTEGAAEGHGLYLNYGATEDGEAAALAVGNEIVGALESHGLRTEWDGSWRRRIAVSLDWKRRRGTVGAGG